eukprot:4923158-Prymnesium_polylepis.1
MVTAPAAPTGPGPAVCGSAAGVRSERAHVSSGPQCTPDRRPWVRALCVCHSGPHTSSALGRQCTQPRSRPTHLRSACGLVSTGPVGGLESPELQQQPTVATCAKHLAPRRPSDLGGPHPHLAVLRAAKERCLSRRVRDGTDGSRVARTALHNLAGGHRPNDHSAGGFVRAEHVRLVVREARRRPWRLQQRTLVSAQLTAAADVPQPHARVAAGGQEKVAARAEGDGGDGGARVRAAHRAHAAAIDTIPDLDRVGRTRREARAVGRPRGVCDRPRVVLRLHRREEAAERGHVIKVEGRVPRRRQQ